MPAVTVIIPFRNRLEWVAESVQSVLSQSFADFEVILVDDGSDHTIDFFTKLSDPRIQYVKQDHKGAAVARNHGIGLAKGKYLAFLDSDDRYLPNKLERQVSFMEGQPEALFSHTSYQRFDSSGTVIDTVHSGTFGGQLYPQIIWGCPIATPTVMARREVFNVLRFEEGVRYGEDVLLWVRIARNCEIFGLDEPLTQVRMHGGNAVLNAEKQLEFACFLLARSFAEDRTIGWRYRAKGKSAIYSHQAYLYYKAHKISSCARYFLLALAHHPPEICGYLAMAWRRLFGSARGRSVYD